ncbi:hypothetical protein NL676_019941 [Syzygium grande]|nr:hypothetical protein NL676_019941 [Syzygium grande]
MTLRSSEGEGPDDPHGNGAGQSNVKGEGAGGVFATPKGPPPRGQHLSLKSSRKCVASLLLLLLLLLSKALLLDLEQGCQHSLLRDVAEVTENVLTGFPKQGAPTLSSPVTNE